MSLRYKTFLSISLLSLGSGLAHAAIPVGSVAELRQLHPSAASTAAVTAIERRTMDAPPAPGRQPQVVRALKALGPDAADAMRALVLRHAGPAETTRATERARVSLVAGALEALTAAPDGKSAALAGLVLSSGEQSAIVLGAAAHLLGHRAEPADLDRLITLADAGDELHRSAALTGLGRARTSRAMRYLAARIRRTDAALPEVAEAASFAGSSWAWEALGPAREAEGRTLRGELVDALVQAWPSANDEARAAVERALLVIDANGASEHLAAISTQLTPAQQKNLTALQTRLQHVARR